MRDIIFTLIVLGVLPFALARPMVGVLLWAWIALASPHRLTWGFAADLPWAMVAAVAAVIAITFSREPKRLPLAAPVIVLLLFVLWTTVTSVFSTFPSDAWDAWRETVKTQFLVLCILVVAQTRERIKAVVWVVTLALGFYGVKGGLYTLAQGGGGMVVGPPASYIEGNTEIALALTMTVPLMFWLRLQTENRWIRHALAAGILLTALAILGSYSRGGLLALGAMAVYLALQTRRKIWFAFSLALIVPTLLAVMPADWFSRMRTINSYEQDASAQGRINAWNFAMDVSAAHPVVGGGFRTFQPEAYYRYAGRLPSEMFDAHSIWFQVVAEHGYIGLGLYALIWGLSWRTARQIRRLAARRNDLQWAADLARLALASLVGFWVGGSFLGLAYWNFPYVLVALLVLTSVVVSKEVRAAPAKVLAPLSPGFLPSMRSGPRSQA